MTAGSTSPTRSRRGRAASHELKRVSAALDELEPRPAALRGARNRPHHRAAAVQHLAGGQARPPSTDRAPAQHPHRGGVHDPRPRARRRRGDARPSRCSPPARRSPGCRSASRAAARSQIDAEQGAEVLRGMIAADDGAARLGEVALVDREGRIGPLGTVFYDTLLDENAASHIALGHGYVRRVGDPADIARANTQRHPHRLHDREQRGRCDRISGQRRRGPAAARRRLADLSAGGAGGTALDASPRHATLSPPPERCRSG